MPKSGGFLASKALNRLEETLPITVLALSRIAADLDPAALGALLVPVVLVGLHRLERHTARAGTMVVVLALAVVLVIGTVLARTIARDIADPPETDFLAFWFPARVAAAGLDFYDPASYRGIASGYSVEFREESLDAGFWYPPPSMFLVLPIGLLAVHTAAMAWYGVQIVAFIAAALLLWRTFVPASGPAGLAGCVALALLLRTTFTTLDFAQTNFLELLWLLGLWRDRDRPRTGVWLALAVITKPFALALVAFLAIRRCWAGLAVAFGALAALSIAAVLVFGPATSAAYYGSGLLSRVPAFVYSQEVNQSLWATLLRMRGLTGLRPLEEPARTANLAGAAIVLAFTAWAATRRGLGDRLLFALVLVSALVLYPVSVEHYSVLLLLPVLMTWAHPESVPGGRVAIGIAAVITFLLVGVSSDGVFWAYAVLWIALLVAAGRGRRTRLAEA